MWVKRATLESKKEGVPIDAEAYLEGQERETQKSPSQIAGVHGLSVQVEMGREENFVFLPQDHVDFQVVTGRGESPVVIDVHSDEGRDVEFFFESMLRLVGTV